VDEDYAELMLEDMTAQERAALREEFTTDTDTDASASDAPDGDEEEPSDE
jgi:hypothetical protein